MASLTLSGVIVGENGALAFFHSFLALAFALFIGAGFWGGFISGAGLDIADVVGFLKSWGNGANAALFFEAASSVGEGVSGQAQEHMPQKGGLAFLTSGRALAIISIGAVLVIMGLLTGAVMTTNRLRGSSLFNRLFVIVAVTSAFFSGVSSAIGFGLITSQESTDFFRNVILPPAFGVFVFFVTVAIWVGGSELVRNRDWFRHLDTGGRSSFLADAVFFVERCVKLFVVIPVLAVILFFISTWTSVVGIAGVDSVRYTYTNELNRLQAECNGIVRFRQEDFLFLDDLTLAVGDVRRAARNERLSGGQTGLPGRGAATDYIDGVADWLAALEQSARAIIFGGQEEGAKNQQASPYDPSICAEKVGDLRGKLSRNAFENYDLWAREFETDFEEFRLTLNRWRLDRRLVNLMDQQLSNFDRANPKPYFSPTSQRGALQNAVIDRYSTQVTDALKSLVRKQKLRKPPVPLPSEAQLSPARGLEIFTTLLEPEPVRDFDPEGRRKRRTQAEVEAEFIAGLSTITPRDAVLKNFNIFSDVWLLALSWDYASYILLLAYLLFPSAERAAFYKDPS